MRRPRSIRSTACLAAALVAGPALTGCGPRSEEAAAGPGRDSLCAGIHNVYECAQEVEAHRLGRLAADVERSGDTLRIPLRSGETVTLVDHDAGGADNLFYTYRDHLSGIGYHVVDIHYYEGGEHLVIDDSTGERTRLSGPPVVSPDAERIVVASAAGAAGYTPNELQVWRVEPDGLALEWELHPDDWGAEEPRWEGPGTVRFQRSRWCPEEGGMCREPALLRHRDGDWQVTGPQ